MKYVIQENEITCLNCGTQFYGRSDKKFCSSDCKNEFHNKARRDTTLIRKRVETSLERNYRILTNLLKLGIHHIDRTECAYLGFRFEYFTGHFRSMKHEVFSVYDIRYALSATRMFSLERINVLADERPKEE